MSVEAAAKIHSNKKRRSKEIIEISVLWWWIPLLLNPIGCVRLHTMGWTQWLCCCFLVGSSSTLLPCGLPLDSVWTSHTCCLCLLLLHSVSVFMPLYLSPSLLWCPALLLKNLPPSFSLPYSILCFTCLPPDVSLSLYPPPHTHTRTPTLLWITWHCHVM